MSSPSKMFSCVDNVAIMRSPANNSTSKTQWSFPKSQRFKDHKPPSDVIYDLPDTKTKRKAGFGYGKKTDLDYGKNPSHVVPSPDTYNLRSFEDENKIHNKGFFPGYGRDEATANSFINANVLKNPGPGCYDFDEKRQTPKWSLRPRTAS